jgi:hypothetical protein
MALILNYDVTFGDGDSGDVCEWEVELTPEQEAAYKAAIEDGDCDFDNYPELVALIEEVTPLIMEAERENMKDWQREDEDLEEDEDVFENNWSLNVWIPEPNYEED